MKNSFKRLLITFLKDLVKVLPDEDESKSITLAGAVSDPGYFTTLREAHLAIGGLLGEITFLKLFLNRLSVYIFKMLLLHTFIHNKNPYCNKCCPFPTFVGF